MIALIVAICGVATLWLFAGPNEAWSEILVKSGATAAVILIFPFVYLWNLLRIGPIIRRNSVVLLIIVGSLFAICGAGMLTIGVLQLRAPTEHLTTQPDPKIGELQSQVNVVTAQLAAAKRDIELKKKELEAVQLTPTSEKDIQQNRLRFKLDQAKIDKEDLEKTIASVRRSAEAAIGIAKKWAVDPPEHAVGNMPLRHERLWEENTRALQKIGDRVFPEEKFALTPPDPTSRELTQKVDGDAEIKDPDTKQSFRILSIRVRNQEYFLKQVEQKIDGVLSTITSQIRDMR